MGRLQRRRVSTTTPGHGQHPPNRGPGHRTLTATENGRRPSACPPGPEDPIEAVAEPTWPPPVPHLDQGWRHTLELSEDSPLGVKTRERGCGAELARPQDRRGDSAAS